MIGQNSRISELGLNKSKLINIIVDPSSSLEPDNRVVLNSTVNISSPIHINWVTFNYTDTFESVFGSSAGIIHQYPTVGPDRLLSVLHIHGSLSQKPILGVNDVSQIANESFRSNHYFLYEFVKPMYNRGCQNNREALFNEMINKADIIVLMGTSVGVTDSIWWKRIGNEIRPSTSKMILYFPYDPNKDTQENECFKSLWSDEYISFIKEAMGIAMDIESLRNRILVGINKDFLNLRQKK